jgi:hypothetical protein
MRPIPAPRLGDTHGLLRAINQRERLRLDEFITEFSIEELFPPGLENALGRTRQFVSFARSAGLLNEDRGSVELTEIGKRYVRAGDEAAVFDVAPDQAEWLRRQLRERHMTDSIYHGAAIGLSLYASNPPDFHVSRLDFGRALAHLGRAGWDNENTLESQGERYTTFLRDLELVDDESRLTGIGTEAKAELTLPIHASLRDLAGQLNPGGPDAAATEGEAEWAARAAAPAAPEPAPEEQPAPPAEEPASAAAAEPEDPGESGVYEEVRASAGVPAEPAPAEPAPAEPAPAAPPAEPGRPVPPSDIWETAAPDEATRAYSAIQPEQAGAAEQAAPTEPAAAEPEAPDMTSGDPLAASPEAGETAESERPDLDEPEAETSLEGPPAAVEAGDPLAAGGAASEAGDEVPEDTAAPDTGAAVAEDAPAVEAGDPLATGAAAPEAGDAVPGDAVAEDAPAVEAGDPLTEGAPVPEAGEPLAPDAAVLASEPATEPLAPEPEAAPVEPEPVGVDGPGVESAVVADAAPPVAASTREPSGFLDLAAVRTAAEESGLKLPDSVYANLVAALASGKHLVLSGPAGSGKTTLALAVAKAAVQAGRSAGAALTTASPEWSASDTVGRVGEGGFSQGHVLAAAGKKKWLLVDEIDRAQLDLAFGDLSSFLAGLPFSLPDGSREVAAPADWRIVATRDAGWGPLEASPALLRRFAQVDLPRPEQAGLEQAIDAATAGDPTAAAAVKRLLAADLPELGAGVFLDAAHHAAERNALAPASEAELARECFAAYIAPHLQAEPERLKAIEDSL